MNVTRSTTIFAAICALLMVGAAVAPFTAMAGNHDEHIDGLEIEVEQEDGTVFVEVAYNGTPGENASVNVTGDDEEYVYNVTGLTDEDGIVSFTGPNRTIEANVSVGYTNDSGELITEQETVELLGPPGLEIAIEQNGDASATVTVTDNWTAADGANISVETVDGANYSGTGNYSNVSGGILELEAPESTVEVNVTADYEGETATTSAVLYNETEIGTVGPFGQEVSAFVHELQNDSDVTGIGPLVAKFVLENNPGNAPDHAGPPAKLFDEDGNWSPGPPEHTGPKDDDNRGPPGHADGPPHDAESADEDDHRDNGERGPPDHAGPK